MKRQLLAITVVLLIGVVGFGCVADSPDDCQTRLDAAEADCQARIETYRDLVVEAMEILEAKLEVLEVELETELYAYEAEWIALIAKLEAIAEAEATRRCNNYCQPYIDFYNRYHECYCVCP